MSADRYDITVIGGGIQGTGVAQAAVAAGYRVLLLEKHAIASATSSRSSKLIHGGLRYLESGQFALVRKALREREILLRIAPDLVRLVPFYFPVYDHASRRPWHIRTGLSLYALLGGFGPHARFKTLSPAQWSQLDGLTQAGLRAVFQYCDAQTDDAALTRAVAHSAVELGAEVLCPAQCLAAQPAADGYEMVYQHGGRKHTCFSRALVNAAGPWVNQVLQRIAPQAPRLPLDWVQGAHVVLDNPAGSGVYYVEAPQDRRAVFVMPWRDKTLVGTTETPIRDLAHIAPKAEEIDYLRTVYRRYFPEGRDEVVDSFAGVRVLPKSEGGYFHRPRDTVVHFSAANLVSLYGGKLTGYRATAAAVIKRLRPSLPARQAVASTASLILKS